MLPTLDARRCSDEADDAAGATRAAKASNQANDQAPTVLCGRGARLPAAIVEGRQLI